MTIKDYLDLAQIVIWLFAVIMAAIGSHVHFKNKTAENYRTVAVNSARQWIGYYDKQALENPEKFNSVLDHVVKELTAHGYKIGEQRVTDLKALIEYELTKLRMEQAKNGVAGSDLTDKDVSADDVYSPIDQLKIGDQK